MILTGLDVDEMMNKIEIASDIIFTICNELAERNGKTSSYSSITEYVSIQYSVWVERNQKVPRISLCQPV